MSLLFSYCFLPYKHHFSKFSCFGFSTDKKKTRENLAVLSCPKIKASKITFISLQSLPNFAWPQKKDVSSLKISIWFQTLSHGLKRTRNVAKKFELTGSIQPLFSKATYWWRNSHVAHSKSSSVGLDTRKINPYKTTLFPPLLCTVRESVPWVPLRICFCMGWFFPCSSLLKRILNVRRGYYAIRRSLWKRAVVWTRQVQTF